MWLHAFTSGEVTVKLLDEELKEVSDWYGLGLHLDIPTAELDSIRYEPRLCRIQDRKREMFLIWMGGLSEPSWSHVVKALKEIGQERLAHKISLKYGKRKCCKFYVFHVSADGDDFPSVMHSLHKTYLHETLHIGTSVEKTLPKQDTSSQVWSFQCK